MAQNPTPDNTSSTQPKIGLIERLDKLVWGAPYGSQSIWVAAGLRLIRTLTILGRDLAFGQLTLRAMSLVYTTLLSIVPLLALSFSVLKAFGVHNQVQPMLVNLLTPLGEQGTVVAAQIGGFIEQMNVGVLGAVGLALLLYTAISLMQKIEESLNYIWHVAQARSLGERFSRYLSVLLVGPLLVFAALGITGSMMNAEVLRQVLSVELMELASQTLATLTPYILVIAAFTFVYLLLPNAKVRLLPAVVGGVVGGIVWQTAGWLFATFVASSGQYAAIYSGFAILVLFMIWLYVSWLVLLFGASVAFYVQHPEYLYLSAGEPRLSNRVRERLALSAMHLASQRFLAGEAGPSHADFTRSLGVPSHVLSVVLQALEEHELLVQTAQTPPLFLPARAPSLISVSQVLDTIRAAGESGFFLPSALPAAKSVNDLIQQAQEAVDASVGHITMHDLASMKAAASTHAASRPADNTDA
ncbi:ribonuclease BN [Hydrogenophaga crassostreae]|uniref:Ribonuclease BN n=1 Tax=Hydrogenophaga crassostreae TaxID=1763535 RepID=A0A167H651_9BURK|nr:YihY/virulence factor BrkB family protein [Hydrogenophaga crassostreae]AOW12501.1 ribonuclease BN [Hydrogenophaga crassostreae]OAD40366.1 ribonuclease BN [Hydrogenophaga crassostreae]